MRDDLQVFLEVVSQDTRVFEVRSARSCVRSFVREREISFPSRAYYFIFFLLSNSGRVAVQRTAPDKGSRFCSLLYGVLRTYRTLHEAFFIFVND